MDRLELSAFRPQTGRSTRLSYPPSATSVGVPLLGFHQRAQLFPTITTNPGWSRTKTSGNLGRSSTANAGSTTSIWSLPLDVSWTPDFFGKIRSQIREAQYAAQVSAADLEVERLLEQAVVGGYVQAGMDEMVEEYSRRFGFDQPLWLQYIRYVSDLLRGDFNYSIANYPRTVIVISHDRDLLETSVDQILHLDRGKLTLYKGSYSSFEEQRATREMLDAKHARRQADERKRLQAFVDRFKAKASKARQAQSRVKMLERMKPITALVTQDVREISFPVPERMLSPPIIAVDDVSVGYDPKKPVLNRVTLRIDTDDRIALLGSNGNGKSTLVKLFANRLAPFSGKITRADKLSVAYFAQHQLDELNEDGSPYDHVRKLMPDAPETKVRGRTGAIGFSGPIYGAAKHGVVAMSHTINQQECINGIRSTVFLPGEVATPILDKRPNPVGPEERARMVQSEDCGDLIRYIACMPRHLVMSEVMLAPTWNRTYIANLQQKL